MPLDGPLPDDLSVCQNLIRELLLRLHDSGKMLFVAEQNNGFLLQNLLKVLYRRRQVRGSDNNAIAINTLTAEGRPAFIHSGTYEELTDAFGLSASQLAELILSRGGDRPGGLAHS